MKTLFFLILMFVITTNLYSQFSGGAGTQADPYQITSRQDMEALADSVDNIDNWSNGKHFKLMNDITDSIKTVVGYARNTYEYTHYFKGDFDGNGKKITLSIDGKWTIATRDFIGLFSAIYEAKIYDLAIDGYVKGKAKLGGICGYSRKSNISNCKNYCDITGDVIHANSLEHVGGICGYSYENSNISDCINYGNIESYINRVGGIIGGGISSIITNCINYGKVNSQSSYVGGIVGEMLIYNSSDIFSNCHNYGNISGEHAVGGITGCIANLIYYEEVTILPCILSNCTNSGFVTATSAAGGIAGHTHKESGISYCINIGTVRGDSVVGGIASGYDNIKEKNNGSIQNCHNAGLVIGNNIVGGIQGRCWGEIHNSLNTGVVIGETNTGGIAGEVSENAVIQNCHYDKQMCIYGGIVGNDIAGQAEGHLTKELIGSNLQAKLSSTEWNFSNPNLYPTLSYFTDNTTALVAASPAYLYNKSNDFDRQNKVRTDFKVNLENGVKWDKMTGKVDIVNDSGWVVSNGSDTLVCSIGNYKKLVPLNIELQLIVDANFTIWATEHKLISPTASDYSIPIYIKSDTKTLREIVIKSLTIEINKNIFYAKRVGNNATISCNENSIKVENVRIPKLNAGEAVVLCNIIGDMLLGNTDSSNIILQSDVAFSEVLSTEPELQNGYITLNICREGSDRFVTLADNLPKLVIKNNPVEDILEVECSVIESGKHSLQVIDIIGDSVFEKEFVASSAGELLFEIDVKRFGAGRYMVVVVSPSGERLVRGVVKR